jgi:hypothetical protein
MGLWLRCAVCPSASGLPRPHPRRAPGPCRIPGFPVGLHRLRRHLAVIRWSAGSRLRSALTDRVLRPHLVRPGTPGRTSLPDPRSLPLVALRPDAVPPGSSVDRVVPSASVTWRSVHAPAGFRVLLHRRVRVPRLRCRQRVTSSFLGFVSPSRHRLHRRGCLRSPEGPIPLPVCVWAACSSRFTRRTAEGVCPVVGAATVAGHGLPGVLDVKEQLLRTWGSRLPPEGLGSRRSRRS